MWILQKHVRILVCFVLFGRRAQLVDQPGKDGRFFVGPTSTKCKLQSASHGYRVKKLDNPSAFTSFCIKVKVMHLYL